MNYGLPYKGSKNTIARQIVDFLPPAENFYDLFAGGCAITHAALLSGKYKHIYFNDINADITQLFLDAIHGKFKGELRWISSDDYYKLKNSDAYIKFCWSFGNTGKHYLYSKEIEPYKKACHYAVVLDEWDLLKELCPETWEAAYRALNNVTNRKERRLKFGPAIVAALKSINDFDVIKNNPLYMSCHFKNGKKDLTEKTNGGTTPFRERLEETGEVRIQSLERLERLERLESLERLERLERQERITRLNQSYDKVKIKPNSVIYCDIPYRDTDGYGMDFDYEKFYSWAERQSELVIISEYNMPDAVDVEDYQKERGLGYYSRE